MTPFKNTNRVTSPFGYREYRYNGKLIKERHKGIDVCASAYPGASADWSVREVTGGQVVRIRYDNARGKYIDVQTDKNTFERYQHLAEIYVTVGQNVAQGQIIAKAGSTGMSTGTHLHFGVYRGGTAEANAINPAPWLGLPNVANTYKGNDDVDVPQETEEPQPNIYTVKHGDSWWKIAQQQIGAGSKMYALAKANGKSILTPLRVGDKIKIEV